MAQHRARINLRHLIEAQSHRRQLFVGGGDGDDVCARNETHERFPPFRGLDVE